TRLLAGQIDDGGWLATLRRQVSEVVGDDRVDLREEVAEGIPHSGVRQELAVKGAATAGATLVDDAAQGAVLGPDGDAGATRAGRQDHAERMELPPQRLDGLRPKREA